MVQASVITWPGVVGTMSGRYTCSRGISPGIGNIVCSLPPQALPIATCTIGDTERTITLPDCAVVDIDYSDDASGDSWTVTFHDRRWRWKFGSITGRYNQTDERGKLIPWSIRSPKELVELCLAEMGETDYEIDIPEGLESVDFEDEEDWFPVGENAPESLTNPRVDWVTENPAQALARLCDFFGRAVVYDPISNKVKIVKPGEGAELPANYLEKYAGSLTVPAQPKGYGIIGEPIKYQVRLALEYVGLEWNDYYYPGDTVSYAPAIVGDMESPWDYSNLDVLPTDQLNYFQAMDRANRSIFRAYRISNFGLDGTSPIKVPGYGKPITNRRQIELTDTMVEQLKPTYSNPDVIGQGGVLFVKPQDFYNGYSRERAARVYGVVRNHLTNGHYQTDRKVNTEPGDEVNAPFTIDPINQLVIFDREIYEGRLENGVGRRRAPELVLETGVYVRDADTNEFERFAAWYTVGDSELQDIQGTLGEMPADMGQYAWFNLPNFASPVLSTYEYVDGPGHSVTDISYPDQEDALQRCRTYLDGLRVQFELSAGQNATYLGIWPVELDGAIQQVTWTVGGGGPQTNASRNTEHAAFLPPLVKRRREENLAPDPFGSLQNRISKSFDVNAKDVARAKMMAAKLGSR